MSTVQVARVFTKSHGNKRRTRRSWRDQVGDIVLVLPNNAAEPLTVAQLKQRSRSDYRQLKEWLRVLENTGSVERVNTKWGGGWVYRYRLTASGEKERDKLQTERIAVQRAHDFWLLVSAAIEQLGATRSKQTPTR